ncbi:MAG: tyrosine-protein phosphatase [Oscillospiraceae bacterium]
MACNRALRRLPLQGTNNTRDLGGYPCVGGSTRWGAFFRSDSPFGLTQADIALLKTTGVTDAVDLRSDHECENFPSPLDEANGFVRHHIPLVDQVHSHDFEGDLPGSMSGLYISLLDDSQSDVARVFRAFISARGGVLFHCAVGKDRTGVVSMLLLLLAGASEADVVADYSISETYMREVFEGEKLNARGRPVPLYVLRSMPDSMWRVLDHLQKKYGTAEDYLRAVGLNNDEIDAVRDKILERWGA